MLAREMEVYAGMAEHTDYEIGRLIGAIDAHGLSAAPLAGRYARWYERHPRDKAPPMESASTEVTRPRGPGLVARGK